MNAERLFLILLPVVCIVLFALALIVTIMLGRGRNERKDGLEPINHEVMKFYMRQK